jgi:hypothetical protein
MSVLACTVINSGHSGHTKTQFCLLQLNADVNAFQRKFVSEVRRCDELERKLRYIEAEVNKENLHIPEIEDLPHAPNPREIIDLEV